MAIISAARSGRDAKPLPGTPLRELAGERRIGTAVRVEALQDDKAYRQLVAQQFSAVTPENEMKWALIEPERGEFEFSDGDALVRRAGEFGQQVRGHTLVWHFQLPVWVEDLDRDELRSAMREHIRRVAGHYRGEVPVWDVVNEVVADSGRLRPSLFLRRLGREYIRDAFELAREADPKARLYINEIGADGINPKSDRLYELVRELRGDGVPVDGVGFQAHLNLQGAPEGFRENLERFAALGVEVAITEADVALPREPSEHDLRRQAGIYREIVETCRAVAACRSLTFWGFTDGRSWISETQAGLGAATLLDEKLRPKPAYRAVQRALGS